jgi:hypothetical protein
MKRERYCKRCEEFFTLTDYQIEYGHDPIHGCGEDSIPADEANVKTDSDIYDQENPR